MKIGVLTEIISGHSGARAPLEIGVQLAKLGHDVTIYAYDFWSDNTMYTYLHKHHVKTITLCKPRLGKYAVIPRLFWLIRRNKPQILYFSGTPAFFIAGYLTGIPIVRMYQGTQFDAYLERFVPKQPILLHQKIINLAANIFIYLIDFMSFRLSSAVVAISRYAKREGETLYRRNVAAIICHGITNFSTKAVLEKNERNIHILSVSRITPYKGFHLIISALNQINKGKPFTFTIVGSQPKTNYVAYLKKLAGSWLKIIIDPPDRALARMYQKSDIYATCDRYLYFGLPIGEAARFGKPAVSLKSCAANEVIKHGHTGFIAENSQELSMYLEKLIRNSKLRQRMGIQARDWIQRFTWERSGKEWEKILLKYARL